MNYNHKTMTTRNKIAVIFIVAFSFIMLLGSSAWAAEGKCSWASWGCESGTVASDENRCDSKTMPASQVSRTGSVQNPKCCCTTGTPQPVEKPKFVIPELQIKIPGLNLASTNTILTEWRDDGSYKIEIPWIAQYIKAIYDYGLSIAGILAALVLMGGGLLWLMSGGEAGKITQAKELISGSLIGLAILLCSYIILTEINPNLTKLGSIKIDGLAKSTIEEPEGDKETEKAVGGTKRATTTHIVIHTAAAIVTRDEVNKYHTKKGWKGIGYNIYIERDGTVVVGRGEDVVGAHSLKYNRVSLGIAYSGCSDVRQHNNKSLAEAVSNQAITQTQLDALVAEIKKYQTKYNIPRANVIGHYEEPVNKACPCLPLDELRALINP